jgi:hypothetical protein
VFPDLRPEGVARMETRLSYPTPGTVMEPQKAGGQTMKAALRLLRRVGAWAPCVVRSPPPGVASYGSMIANIPKYDRGHPDG